MTTARKIGSLIPIFLTTRKDVKNISDNMRTPYDTIL